MTTGTSYDLAALEARLLRLLAESPGGLGEYDLLKCLQAGGCAGFPPVSLLDRLPLFRMHFLLFHALYRLRERLWAARSHHLEIGPLRIALEAYRPGQAGLVEYDALRAYYGDLARLENTTEQDLAELLGKFWGRFHAWEKKKDALAVLELVEPVDYATIRKRYRALAMRLHPDRGGDTARLQQLNAAMALLAKYYRA